MSSFTVQSDACLRWLTVRATGCHFGAIAINGTQLELSSGSHPRSSTASWKNGRGRKEGGKGESQRWFGGKRVDPSITSICQVTPPIPIPCPFHLPYSLWMNTNLRAGKDARRHIRDMGTSYIKVRKSKPPHLEEPSLSHTPQLQEAAPTPFAWLHWRWVSYLGLGPKYVEGKGIVSTEPPHWHQHNWEQFLHIHFCPSNIPSRRSCTCSVTASWWGCAFEMIQWAEFPFQQCCMGY